MAIISSKGADPLGNHPPYRYSHTMGMYQPVGRGFNNPVDLAVGKTGVMYVLNRAGSEAAARMPNKRITMITEDEDYIGEFGSGGTSHGQLMWPSSIAISSDDKVYVSDEALQRITVFDCDGHPLTHWGTEGSKHGQFDRPASIAFDQDENLLVVDGINHRIQRYTTDGTFLGGWGNPGNLNGEFDFPWGITVDELGNVYVADWRNDRIQKFNSIGEHISTLGTPGDKAGELNRPAGLAVDKDGYVYVADWGNERLQIFDHDGSFVALFRGNGEPSKWSDEYFRANPDELEERQKANMEPPLSENMPPREESASIEKFFWGPTSVVLGDRGKIFVVDSCRHRVQVYVKN